MVNLDGTKAVSKAAKGTHDRLKALEVAIYNLRSSENDKNWQNVEKCLQVVLKVSDIQVIMEHEHLLLNLHWILSKNTAPTTPVMNAIQFLTKICSQVPRSRAFLRDNLGLASTLTNLLVSLGVNSSSKSSKVLELLRFVSHGISIIRQESYLEKLIVQLLRFIHAKDSNSSAALGILACLCHNNYLVGKLLLASMTAEERKDLYASSFEDVKTKVYLDFLITCLSRRHFVSTGSKSLTNERHLTALSDAFCGAYAENDCVTLKLCIDFVKELSEDLTQQRDQMREKLMHIIKQLFCAADFSEGTLEANGLLFCFARHLAFIHGYNLQLVDVTAKAVLLYAETINSSNVRYLNEAILMFTAVLNEAVLGETGGCIKDETLMSSLKLQVDPLVSAFNVILSGTTNETTVHTKNLVDEEDTLRSLRSILECSYQIAKIDDWAEVVSAHLASPASILSRMRGLEDSGICTGPLLAAFFNLAQTLKVCNKKWKSIVTTPEAAGSLETIMGPWTICYKRRCCPQDVQTYFKIMQQDETASELFWKLSNNPRTSENQENQTPNSTAEKGGASRQQFLCVDGGKNKIKEVDQIISNVAAFIENNDINECLAGVWELQEYKLMAHQSKTESLKEALKAADDEISHQKSLNTQLETENTKLNKFTRTILHRMDTTRKEIIDVRKQCDAVNQDASAFRAETSKDLKRKQEDIEVLEANQAKLESKVSKYKEKCETLTETIKEHQTVQAELHEKVKIEAKTNAELTVALTKKEEKLKKKEKLLEEYSSSGESQKKEITEIKNLNKRLEQALAKKEKQYTKVQEKLSTFEQIQAQIFSLSKTVQSKDDDE